MIIYKITNDINDKIYIGQTIFDNLNKRISSYKSEIQNPKCHRPIIEAIREYGIEHFSWEIIESGIENQEELDKKEIYYIQKFQSLTKDNGYNADIGGRGQGPRSEETKRKIGEAQKGELNHMYGKVGSQNAMSKRIIELTTGKIYESACEAAKDLNIGFSHVCATARGKRGSTGGFVFLYIDEDNNFIIPEKLTRIKNVELRNSLHEKYPNIF